MKLLHELENRLLGYIKDVPHLPPAGRKWLGDNVWWIVLVGVIIGGFSVLFSFFGILGSLAILGTAASSYYVLGTGAVIYGAVVGFVSLVFTVISLIISAIAVRPLQNKEKRGWVLLFIVWLINLLAIVVGAILTLNAVGFIIYLLFGAVVGAAVGYFLFEIHGQFGHTAKIAKPAKKAE